MTSKEKDIQVKEKKNTRNYQGVEKNPLCTGKMVTVATGRFKKPQISALQNQPRSQSVALLNLSPVLVISSRT